MCRERNCKSVWSKKPQECVVKETDALGSQILVILYILLAEQLCHSQCSLSVSCLIKKDTTSNQLH